MRLGVLLAILVALIVVVARATRHKPQAPAAAETEVTEEELVAPPPARPSPRMPPRLRGDDARVGVAHLTGRVSAPAGAESATLVVTADDGARSFEAKILDDDARYTVHLPAGRYTLTASRGDLVGVASDVLAPGGLTREIDIALSPGAEISGSAHLPSHSDEVTLTLTAAGHDDVQPNVVDEDGKFSVPGLVPGRHYDLAFTGDTVRSFTLRDVTAPATGLQVTLEAAPVLRVAVGFPPGEPCPINSYELRTSTTTVEPNESPHADCTFELRVPEAVFEATVVATGEGWHLEQRVAIPEHGQPAPVCLNPPCRAKPLEDTASVHVIVEGGGPESSMRGFVSGLSLARGSQRYCRGQTGCTVPAVPTGVRLTVGADVDGCRIEPQLLVPVAGENQVRLPCRRFRRVEGLVRSIVGGISVGCAGEWRVISESWLFRLDCPLDVQVLEVKSGLGVQHVPIPPGDPALVEIVL